MKVIVETTHELRIGGDENISAMAALVNFDSTIKITLSGHIMDGDSSRVQTLWMGREELLQLRALITKALTYLPT